MAEAVFTFAIEEIVKQLISLVAKEIGLGWGLQGELENLQTSLIMVRAVLGDADSQQVEKESVRLWLMKLKDIAYNADDVLDEFRYNILMHKVVIQGCILNKVCNFFSLYNPFAFHIKMAHKVKRINASLDKVVSKGSDLRLRGEYQNPIPRNTRETHALLDHDMIYGREDDVSKIVQMLVSSENNSEELTVIPIVGMAGLGKTTLARLIYHDYRVKENFDVRIWVSVSNNFEVKRILREILECLVGAQAGQGNLNNILYSLKKELGGNDRSGKKYLLVLDGVWDDAIQNWDELKSCLLGVNGCAGNCIVATTRSKQVASKMGTLLKYQLEKLSDTDCWSIFKGIAFGKGGATMTPELEAIGRRIVEKFKGIPFVAKVLGPIMHSKKEKHQWLSIENSGIWELLANKNEILPVLKLSFDQLPSASLKQCFAYCSIFLKDFDIQKEQLVQLWMAQGFLDPPEGSSNIMEDVGNENLDSLVANTLFQDVRKDEYGNITHCKMHDLFHELASSVSKSETLSLGSNSENDVSVRHLSLFPGVNTLPRFSGNGACKLRTLALWSNISVSTALSNFKSLRSLTLHGTDIEELPEFIGKLIHLRYLDASGTKIKAFPKSIIKLYNLQTLRLLNCYSLNKLPRKLTDLISLRHMYIDERHFHSQMPIGLGSLTSLQTLPFFSVGKGEGHKIKELGFLDELRGELKICKLENVKDGEEAKGARVSQKIKVHKLKLQWASEREGNNNDEDVLEGLQPHKQLKSLVIENFLGKKVPSWLTMCVTSGICFLLDMVDIKLINCKKCEKVPTFGQLPHLKTLEIDGMENVTRIGVEFYGSGEGASTSSGRGGNETRSFFPGLRRFTLRNMGKLKDWVEADFGAGSGTVFPNLEKLIIKNCPLLESAPTHFPFLRELRYGGVAKHKVSGAPLTNICSKLTTLTSISLWMVSSLCVMPEGLMERNISLASLNLTCCVDLVSLSSDHQVWGCQSTLRSVSILACPKLTALPDQLSSFGSLEKLRVTCCPNLASLPSVEGLKSLRDLTIFWCEKLECLPMGLKSCTSLRSLTVCLCPNLISGPDFQELQSLSSLFLGCCPKLKSLHEDGLRCPSGLRKLSLSTDPLFPEDNIPIKAHHPLPATLQQLELDGWSKLKTLPQQLQRLTSLKCLEIAELDGIESLPEWLSGLASLQELEIRKCKNLKYLPSVEGMKQLKNLRQLRIKQCPALEDRCTKDGSEWDKVSHISVDIIHDSAVSAHSDPEEIASLYEATLDDFGS